MRNFLKEITTVFVRAVRDAREYKRCRVGFWKSAYETHLPDVKDFVDAAWSTEERATVIAYLKDGHENNAYFGYSRCRCCNAQNGNTELTDDEYIWPEGLAHYLEAHAVKPPQEFIDHVLERS